MKFKEIISKIAKFTNSPLGDILTAVIPGLGVVDKIVDTANNVFGDVTDKTTVGELQQKVEHLSESDRLELEEKEIDLAIVASNNYAAVAIAQEASNNSTRPKIAMQMADLFISLAKASFLFLIFCMAGDIVIIMQGKNAVFFDIAMAGLPWIAGVYAVPAMGIIQSYFARRSDDKKTAASLSGITMPEGKPSGMVQSLVNLFRRK